MNMNMNRRTKRSRIAAFALVLGLVAAAMPALAQARTGAPATAAPRARITTLHFHNIPVRSALQLLAEEGNFNLVVSDSVQGTVSLKLVDVTWEEALDVVLRLKGLHKRVDGASRSMTVTRR